MSPACLLMRSIVPFANSYEADPDVDWGGRSWRASRWYSTSWGGNNGLLWSVAYRGELW